MCLYQWILLLSGTPRLRNDLLCIKLDVNLYILDGLLMFKCLILKIYVCTRAVSVMASWGHWLCMKFLTTFEVQTAATREQIIFNFNGYYVLWHNSLLFIQELRWLWPLILNEKCDRYSWMKNVTDTAVTWTLKYGEEQCLITAKISTYSDCNSTSGYCAHIETDCWNHICTELTALHTTNINSYNILCWLVSPETCTHYLFAPIKRSQCATEAIYTHY